MNFVLAKLAISSIRVNQQSHLVTGSVEPSIETGGN